MSDQEQLQSIFQRYLQGQCKPEELEQVLSYFGRQEESEGLKALIAAHLENQEEFEPNIQQGIGHIVSNSDEVMRDFFAQRLASEARPVRLINWWWSSAAGVLLLSLSIGLYFYKIQTTAIQESRLAAATEIHGLGNRAVLTLADGSTVELNDNQSGIIIGDNDIKYADGSGIGHQGINSTSKSNPLLSLSTPKGAQYQVTLSDGTKVWLNAASSLSYPVRFEGGIRQVTLTGEAYFEVTSDKSTPFIVHTAEQQVTVTGTKFNIQAYRDATTATSLLSGIVNVKDVKGMDKITLKPGQQAVLVGDGLVTNEIDVNAVAAWVGGEFVFSENTLAEILPQLARWYDIDIAIKEMPKEEFFINISRDMPLSNVLKAIEESSMLQFEISGRRLTLKTTK